jgi:hypothetical protein
MTVNPVVLVLKVIKESKEYKDVVEMMVNKVHLEEMVMMGRKGREETKVRPEIKEFRE